MKLNEIKLNEIKWIVAYGRLTVNKSGSTNWYSTVLLTEVLRSMVIGFIYLFVIMDDE